MVRLHAAILLAALLLTSAARAGLSPFERIDVATFEEMREIERYQIKIAEKHYTNGDFRLALTEYEKFLTLYEKSPGAPYAQLMWSHCMLHLKKPVTAMREGFQSVIDYWPESREATVAAYCMGDAYRRMGEVAKASAAFRRVIDDYPETGLALESIGHLLHYARLHQDAAREHEILARLTFDWKRTEDSRDACVNASRELAMIHFRGQDFERGRKALATSYADARLEEVVFDFTVEAMRHLLGQDDGRPAALRLGDQLLASLRRDSDERPDEAKALLYRACGIHAMLGRPADVWRLYGEIGDRWGRDDELLGRMARWCLDRGRQDQALELYREYADAVAGQEAIAALLTSEGRLEEAIAVYLKLIDLNGTAAAGYQRSIAGCHEGLGQWREAIAMYRQIDGFPDTHFSMAACHRRLGEFDRAIALYEECRIIDRVAARAALEIGFTHEQAGSREKAIRAFQLTCRRHPKSSAASRAHAHLQEAYEIHVTLGGGEEG